MALLLIQKMEKNWLLIISILFIGCIQNTDPSYLIPQDTLKAILTDVYGDESLVSLKNNTNDTIQKKLTTTLEKYQVADTIYKKTLLFYIQNPDKLLEIIEDIESSKES